MKSLGEYQAHLILIFQFICFVKSEHKVVLTSNSPLTRGATARFTATLYNDGSLASGKYLYIWRDNAIPGHYKEITSEQPIVTWDVEYTHDYPMGEYDVQVTVKKDYYVIFYEVTSARLYFTLTDTLNGKLMLTQNGTVRAGDFISTHVPVNHSVNLTEADAGFVSNATSVTTFWFIDCIYYGPTNDMKFSHVFPISDEEHTIDALVMADFHKPVPTTTPKPSSSSTTTTITPVPSGGTTTKHSVRRRDTFTQNIRVKNTNGTLVKLNETFPYVCNGTVALDEHKSYGYFTRKITAKTPITSVNVTGNNWLQDSDMLALNVVCDGAPSLRYCVEFYEGSYNATGNETCKIYISLDSCNFMIQRFFVKSKRNTVLIVLQNDVTKVVKTVAVTIYEVKRQAQLSVIVVPVAFSLVAVVMIVFGVAYYLQNRRRFIVEVADFNFGVDYEDLEYKTFRERLQESVINAFTRAPSPELNDTWNASQQQGHGQQKYGSMT